MPNGTYSTADHSEKAAPGSEEPAKEAPKRLLGGYTLGALQRRLRHGLKNGSGLPQERTLCGLFCTKKGTHQCPHQTQLSPQGFCDDFAEDPNLMTRQEVVDEVIRHAPKVS